MESPNIKHVPLNPVGALELGMSPCSACDVGWATYTTDGKTGSCQDTCPYWAKYKEQISQVAKNRVKEVLDSEPE